MSMHAASLDHRLWLLAAVLTHAAIGYVLAAVLTECRPSAGLVGGVLPDVDLLFDPSWSFPLVHRGVTHAPVFAAVVVGVVAAIAPLRWAWPAVALGLGSHVLFDSLTATGVPWLYPLSTTRYGIDASIHAVDRQAVVWLLVVLVVVLRARARE